MIEIELDYDSTTDQLLDYMSNDCEWAADEVRSRVLAMQERLTYADKMNTEQSCEIGRLQHRISKLEAENAELRQKLLNGLDIAWAEGGGE